MRIPVLFVAAAAAAAALSTACDGTAFVVSPSGVAIVSPLSVVVAPAPIHADAFTFSTCQTGTRIAPAFAVTLVASSAASLDRVTLQLLDGSHVGGPMVTVPQSELTTTFGTVLVTTGARRVLTVRVPSVCGARPFHSVSVEVSGRDPRGASFVATASGPVS
jgi:hypothetical protein